MELVKLIGGRKQASPGNPATNRRRGFSRWRFPVWIALVTGFLMSGAGSTTADMKTGADLIPVTFDNRTNVQIGIYVSPPSPEAHFIVEKTSRTVRNLPSGIDLFYALVDDLKIDEMVTGPEDSAALRRLPAVGERSESARTIVFEMDADVLKISESIERSRRPDRAERAVSFSGEVFCVFINKLDVPVYIQHADLAPGQSRRVLPGEDLPMKLRRCEDVRYTTDPGDQGTVLYHACNVETLAVPDSKCRRLGDQNEAAREITFVMESDRIGVREIIDP